MTSLVAGTPDISSTYVSPSRTGGRADRTTGDGTRQHGRARSCIQEGQRQHIEATRARPSPDPACAETTSSGLQTDHVQTAIHSRLAAVRVYPATSCFIPRPSTRLPASIHVWPAYTQPRRRPCTASSAQRPSSAATQRPLDGGALLCRLALDTTAQSAAPVHHGSS